MAASSNSKNLLFHIASDKEVEDKKTKLSSEIVEPYDKGYLDLNRTVLDLNKFLDDELDFEFENEELNKEVYNMPKIFVDSAY